MWNGPSSYLGVLPHGTTNIGLQTRSNYRCDFESHSVFEYSSFVLDIGFIDRLQVVTTSNDNIIAISSLYKSLQPTLNFFQSAVSSPVVSWQRILTQ
jgi:hypothetical protein